MAIAELHTDDWLHLTFGLFWRSTVWAIISSLLGTAVSLVVAYVLSWAMGDSPDPQAYQRLSMVLTMVGGVGMGFVAFRLFAQWILTARYGSLRLIVVRSGAAERPASEPP